MSDCQGLGDCDDTRMQRIWEYLDGALTVEDLGEIKEHLDACPECAGQYDLGMRDPEYGQEVLHGSCSCWPEKCDLGPDPCGTARRGLSQPEAFPAAVSARDHEELKTTPRNREVSGCCL